MALYKKRTAAASDVNSPESTRVEWQLADVVDRVRDVAPSIEARDVEPDLMRARIADCYRDVGLPPPEASDFERRSRDLDVEGWRLLALGMATLEDDALRPILVTLDPRIPVAARIEGGLLGLAREIAPVTVSLVRQSATRAEEFARHLAMRLGIAHAGESFKESRARLDALDYKRLLAEAEKAKAAAHDKMERLRKSQAETDRRTRRGKW